MTLRYEGDIDGISAAAEAGLAVGRVPEARRRVGGAEPATRLAPGAGRDGRPAGLGADVRRRGPRTARSGALFQASQIGASLPDNTGRTGPARSVGRAGEPDGVHGRRAAGGHRQRRPQRALLRGRGPARPEAVRRPHGVASGRWRSRPTANRPSPAAWTARPGCGTSSPAGSFRSSTGTPAW